MVLTWTHGETPKAPGGAMAWGGGGGVILTLLQAAPSTGGGEG